MKPTSGPKPIVLGITGAAGSGKSTVTRLLAAFGAQTVDADVLVRWTYNDPEFRRTLADRFGEEILDESGAVDRDLLAAVVFDDPEALSSLEQLVHPAVLNQIVESIQAYRADPDRAPVLAVEIPLLYETGAEALVDRVLVVSAPYEVRAARLRERGWDEERIAAVERSQMPLSEKEERADEVIQATGSLDDTCLRVEALWRKLVPDI